jgi:hypothetical protein
MIFPSTYDYARPPILLPDRKSHFVCAVCGKPGFAALNAKVHPGKCRDEWSRRNSARTAERRRRQKLAARAAEVVS